MLTDIYSFAALRRIEEQADTAGIDLMQRAAQVSTEWICRHYASSRHILVAAGSGNNGGDALWVADRLADRGYPVTILVPEPVKSPLTVAAFNACQRRGLPIIEHPSELTSRPDVLIDGLFGIGLNRSLSIDWQTLISTLNDLGLPTIALDVPSGLDAYRGVVYGLAIQAGVTITFLCAKPGLYTGDGADYSGQVLIEPLDVPEEMVPAADGTLQTVSPKILMRKHNSHKGSFGSVCVTGGAAGMLGAAILSGRAALSAGAGKVYVATLESLPVDGCAPELMLIDAGKAKTCKADVYVIGPGLSDSTIAKDWLRTLLGMPGKKVLDADALNLIATDALLAESFDDATECILTPHPAEAARLLQTDVSTIQSNRVEAAQQLAKRFNSVVILKGCGSLICRPDGFYRVNLTGGPALAVAGQGDVLSGVCGALLAQGMHAFDAASLAAQIHGMAGDLYTQQTGGPLGLTASATLALLSIVLNQLVYQDNSPS